jgi:hypothetical protein
LSDKDESISLREEWYYELDGRVHGPMKWSDLEELLSRAGETASQVRVRKGADGAWSAFRSGPPPAPATTATASNRFERLPSARSTRRAGSEGIASFFQGHRDLLAGVGVWILFNVLFLAFWPAPYATERRYLATLEDVVKEADQLRATSASDKDWAELAKRSRERLAPIVADLKKSASSSELSRQQLLWCARDLAPRIMGSQTKEREENERRMKQYLQSVEQAIGRP